MQIASRHIRLSRGMLPTLGVVAMLTLSASAFATPAPQQATAPGALSQLKGSRGCLVDRSKPTSGCGTARALKGPGPFMGSRAIALSPNGRSVYVASSGSDAIAIFKRDSRTGALAQPKRAAGCIAVKGAGGCATAVGLDGPNSVAVSPDGRNVYVTSRASNSISVFHRNHQTGALTQLPAAAGCTSGLPAPVCAAGRGLVGPDVVVVSPDGRNVYVGSFFGNAVAVFARSASTGTLTQPAGGSGCIVDSPLGGCTTGVQLSGANAVAVSPGDGDAYVTSLFSNSVTSFTRATSTGTLAQKEGTAGCLVYLRAVGCSFGRAMIAPEGLAVSPDGSNVYVASFKTGAIDVLDRGRKSGAVAQKPGRPGCLAPHSVPGCTRARALRGVSSIALSPDGRYLYSTSFGSNAVDIFRRNK